MSSKIEDLYTKTYCSVKHWLKQEYTDVKFLVIVLRIYWDSLDDTIFPVGEILFILRYLLSIDAVIILEEVDRFCQLVASVWGFIALMAVQ